MIPVQKAFPVLSTWIIWLRTATLLVQCLNWSFFVLHRGRNSTSDRGGSSTRTPCSSYSSHIQPCTRARGNQILVQSGSTRYWAGNKVGYFYHKLEDFKKIDSKRKRVRRAPLHNRTRYIANKTYTGVDLPGPWYAFFKYSDIGIILRRQSWTRTPTHPALCLIYFILCTFAGKTSTVGGHISKRRRYP